jgi:hypothetical protein
VGDGVSAGVAVAEGDPDGMGVGDPFLRFDFGVVVGLGDGVGEIFFCFGEAEGDGLGVGFFPDRFRCLCGVGVGVGSKIFLIVLPNDSSAASATGTVPPNKIATSKSHFIKSKLATLTLRRFQPVVIPSEVEESLIFIIAPLEGPEMSPLRSHDTMPALGEWLC